MGKSTLSSCYIQVQAPSLKYQLPTEPNVYVDLVDDTDTELMFDEWNDFTSKNRTSSAKLHLFVDWLRPGSERKDQLRSAESANSLGQVPQSHSAGRLCFPGFSEYI